MAIHTDMGSAVEFTGRVYLGMKKCKPEMLVEVHLKSGDADKVYCSLGEITADGGHEELQKAFSLAHGKLNTQREIKLTA